MTGTIHRLDVVMIVIGAIIGWGSFTLPGTTFLPESGVIDTAIGLGIGAIAVLFIQQAYHVMLSTHVSAGGEASYVRLHLGRPHGFVVGWSLVLAYTSIVALNGLAFVLVLKRALGPGVSQVYLYTVAGFPVYLTDVLISSAVMVLFCWINLRGLRASATTENVLVIMLLVNLVLVIGAMFVVAGTEDLAVNYLHGWSPDWSRIAGVVAIVPFLFVGFDVIPQLSRDLNFSPHRVIGLAVLGIVTGSLIYLALTVITGMVYGPQEAASQEWATGAAVHTTLGQWGFVLLVLALLGAVLGGINGFAIAAANLMSFLASDRLLPVGLAHRNHKGVAARAMFVALAIGLLAPWAGREAVVYIVDMSSVLAAVAYGYTCFVSVSVASRRVDKMASVVGLACSAGFIALLLIPGSPGELALPAKISLGVWAVLGVILYFRSHRAAKGPDKAEAIAQGIGVAELRH